MRTEQTKRATAAFVAACMLLAVPPAAAAQAVSPVKAGQSSALKRIAWGAIGAGIGFGAGLLVGLRQFDDAVYAEQKIWAAALVGAAAGGIAGAVLSADGRPTGLPPAKPALEPSEVDLQIGAAQALPARMRVAAAPEGRRFAPGAPGRVAQSEVPTPPRLATGDPLWEGMAVGAAIGAAVGLMIVPAASCKPENPECPGRLRIAVGIPAVAVGAALGAAVDKLRK